MASSDNQCDRRTLLQKLGMGLPALGLTAMLHKESLASAERGPHFAPQAKHVVHLFMNGGPSQVDTFAPKPELDKWHG